MLTWYVAPSLMNWTGGHASVVCLPAVSTLWYIDTASAADNVSASDSCSRARPMTAWRYVLTSSTNTATGRSASPPTAALARITD
jgi:hypothetical protein